MKRKSLRVSVSFVVVLALAGTLPAGAELTLEEVLGFAYPSGVVAAADADRIAWVVNERGVRNLWTATGTGFEPVKLTDYEEDDGQALGGLSLNPDGSILIFVRGSGPNAAGETANPTSDPAGATQALWAIATAGGESWKVADAGGGVISPSGDRVVFGQGSELLEVALAVPGENDEDGGDGTEEEGTEPQDATTSEPGPTTLAQARGGFGGLSFSPGGEHLAFVSNRGDHSFVGVFDREAGKITWMSPSVDRDGSPVWSPDGTRLAFLRRPGSRIGELVNLVGGHPFAVWVGDPRTGQAREIWHSPGDDGGFAQNYLSRPLQWAGGRLVFASEHDGWLHFYSIPAEGGEAVDLTPGPGFVESGVVSQDGETLFFSSNHGDSPRRHLWRVATSGGVPRVLTPGEGIETDPVPLASGRHLAFRGATARRPQQVAVLGVDGGERRTLASPRDAFTGDGLVVPREVRFEASDGLEIHGQLFLPPGAAAGDGRPAVVFMHGGPIRQMLLGFHYSSYYSNCYAFNQYLASRGMVVLSVNFRSGIGYGRAFRRAPEQGPRGASEYRDILAAGRYLQRRPEVDPARIGLWGGSYGGYLTALGLARDSDLFAAGVDLHGVHDWAHRGEAFPLPGGAWALQGDVLLDLATRSSPVADLAYWSSPVLFVHGDDDRNVLFIQTTDLVQRLREREVHVETLIFPDEVHGFLRYESWLRTFRAAADFFERFLARSVTK